MRAAFLAAAALHVVAGICTEGLFRSRSAELTPLFEEGESSVSLTLVATRRTKPKPVQRVEETEFSEPDSDIPEEQSPDAIDPISLPDVSPSILLPPATVLPVNPHSQPIAETRSEEKQVPDHWEIALDLDEESEQDNDADMLKKGAEVFSAGVTEIKPRYPLGSRLRGEEGKVVLDVTIDTRGRTRNVAVKTSSGFSSLDKSAVAAVRRARFVTSGNGSRGGSVILTFEFKLTD